jgi:hypothetical protein
MILKSVQFNYDFTTQGGGVGVYHTGIFLVSNILVTKLWTYCSVGLTSGSSAELRVEVGSIQIIPNTLYSTFPSQGNASNMIASIVTAETGAGLNPVSVSGSALDTAIYVATAGEVVYYIAAHALTAGALTFIMEYYEF